MFAFNTSAPEIILALVFFLFTFIFSFVQAKWGKEWGVPMTLAKLILIIEIVVIYRDYTTLDTLTLQLLKCILIGASVYIVAILVVFPTSANISLEVLFQVETVPNFLVERIFIVVG
jgi:hypothetical protein